MQNNNANKHVSRVELLAPAGNYESFLGAIHAGADAVYLAGHKFGARAYADNFSVDELCRAIRYAHLYDRKVYLTLNTLVKEKEFDEIYDYLMPYYQEGLDGIIIQDLGVLSYVRDTFPGLPLHISTQAMVTGPEGAAFLKEQGAVRVVPARELSLEEISNIKEQTGLELETFIHGAMCYCYSGQCLFSSIAGGRSGNRGRCAQPCRLPYELNIDGRNCFGHEAYPLSLKDMCTIQNLPELIKAGIDSFKIEGRMKKPEYAAGVTSIYRKYIDRWYENPDSFTNIDEKDMQKLSSLYIRSEVQNGYYFRHNGGEMITLSSPAYSGSDEKLLESIREEFLIPEKKLAVNVSLYCHVGEPLLLTMYVSDKPEYCVTMEGDGVEAASKQPVDAATLREKVCKLGNTFFEVEECNIETDGNCFVPMKYLNELRREAVTALEDAILKQKNGIINSNVAANGISKTDVRYKNVSDNQVKGKALNISVLVTTHEQLKACIDKASYIGRIYIESDLIFAHDYKTFLNKLKALKQTSQKLEIYVALPFVIRSRDAAFIEKLKILLDNTVIDGCLVRNIEELGMFTIGSFSNNDIELATDAGMYCFQSHTVKEYNKFSGTIALPYELNGAEKKHMMARFKDILFEQVIYGRIPMMVTANCLAKTAGKCNKSAHDMVLIDRYRHEFPVQNVCEHCYNIIWNCIPLSLHSRLEEYRNCIKRIQFTYESGAEAGKILDFYIKGEGICPVKEYTTGHEKRGVE